MTKIISSRSSGQPAAGVPRRSWPLRPVQFFKRRSIKRTMVNDPANGLTQPEFTNLLPGGPATRGGLKITRQQPQTPPASNAGMTTIRPARNRLRRR